MDTSVVDLGLSSCILTVLGVSSPISSGMLSESEDFFFFVGSGEGLLLLFGPTEAGLGTWGLKALAGYLLSLLCLWVGVHSSSSVGGEIDSISGLMVSQVPRGHLSYSLQMDSLQLVGGDGFLGISQSCWLPCPLHSLCSTYLFLPVLFSLKVRLFLGMECTFETGLPIYQIWDDGHLWQFSQCRLYWGLHSLGLSSGVAALQLSDTRVLVHLLHFGGYLKWNNVYKSGLVLCFRLYHVSPYLTINIQCLEKICLNLILSLQGTVTCSFKGILSCL